MAKETKEKRLYGWYSYQQDLQAGRCIYKGINGQDVTVTQVSYSSDVSPNGFKDSKFVGEVTKLTSRIWPATSPYDSLIYE